MGLDDRYLRDLGNAVYNYVTKDADQRQTAADTKADELARIHREGWKNCADAIRAGFQAVADAIRDSNRR